jgi:hypothetical protein
VGREVLPILNFESNKNNPRPRDVVRVQRLCPLKQKRLNATPAVDVVPTTDTDGESNEPFSKAITHGLALSVPHSLGAEVPIQDFARRDGGRGGVRGSSVCGSTRMRNTGVECSDRPCPPTGIRATKDIDIEIRRDDQRPDSDTDSEPPQKAEEEALLGQPLLGTRVLRRYGWTGRGIGPQVRAVSGNPGKDGGATRIRILVMQPGTTSLTLPPQGARHCMPPMGALNATPSGGGFFTFEFHRTVST